MTEDANVKMKNSLQNVTGPWKNMSAKTAPTAPMPVHTA